MAMLEASLVDDSFNFGASSEPLANKSPNLLTASKPILYNKYFNLSLTLALISLSLVLLDETVRALYSACILISAHNL